MAEVHQSCVGYAAEPFASLVAGYPGEDVYPPADFRTEWGPVFHRGRLDGSARVLVLGQDPATHEAISRRILVGEPIAAYRHRWLDALLVDTDVTAVVALGDLAATAYARWSATQPDTAASLHLAAIRHPTYAEGFARASGQPLAQTTEAQLLNWNEHLADLAAHVVPDGPTDPRPYAATWGPTDLVPIPEADLPPGSPAWWRDVDAWASRTGTDAQTKRATISVVVPKGAQTWPTL